MNQHFHVRADRVAQTLFFLLALLVLANVLISLPYLHRTGEIRGVARILSLDGERNIPTAFNIFLLLGNALLLLLITARIAKDKTVRSIPWLILSVGFVFLAIDEGWTLHEDLIGPIRQRLGNDHLGIFYNAWIIPGIAITAVLGIAYLRFLKELPKATRTGFLLSAAIYLGGALGLEAADGYYLELHGKDFSYKMLTIVEEALEMSGLILFSGHLSDYIRIYCGSIEISFERKAAQKIKPSWTWTRSPELEKREGVPIPVGDTGRNGVPERTAGTP